MLQVETLRKQARVLEGHNMQLQQQTQQLAKENRGMQVRWGSALRCPCTVTATACPVFG
jgi:hypothetical protein